MPELERLRVRRKLSRTQRDVFDEAVTHATEKRWLTEDEEPGHGTPQRILKRGPERPQ